MIKHSCNVIDVSCQGHMLAALSTLEASIIGAKEDDLEPIIRDLHKENMLDRTRNLSRLCSREGMIDGNIVRA